LIRLSELIRRFSSSG